MRPTFSLKVIMASFALVLIAISANAQNRGGSGGGGGGASSSGGGGSMQQKVDKKELKRWTLSEWLSQKEKVNSMDLWLALHTSANPYEFFISGDSLSYSGTVSSNGAELSKTNYRRTRGELGAYASIVGLEGLYESSDEKYTNWAASFNLRIFGAAVQATNLTLSYGLFNQKWGEGATADEVQNQFWGTSLTLYLFKYFGIRGSYKSYLPEKAKLGSEIRGTCQEIGALIDFSFLQVFGDWTVEKIDSKANATTTSTQRQGVSAGLKLFF